MAERTLNDPLADFEIKDIICAEIRKRLDGDCTLMGGQAYAGFQAKFDIKISYTRSLTPATLVWGGAARRLRNQSNLRACESAAIRDQGYLPICCSERGETRAQSTHTCACSDPHRSAASEGPC